MRQVMLDLETTGLSPGCGILEIGAVTFDPEDIGVLGDHFGAQISLTENVRNGFSNLRATMDWWREGSKGLPEIYSRANMAYILAEFGRYLDKLYFSGIRNVWAKPSLFDIPILNAAFDKLQIPRPILLKEDKFRYWRCWLTLKAEILAHNPTARTYKAFTLETAHSALEDAMVQADQASMLLSLVKFQGGYFELPNTKAWMAKILQKKRADEDKPNTAGKGDAEVSAKQALTPTRSKPRNRQNKKARQARRRKT